MQISLARPSELGPGEITTWRTMQRQTESLANPFLSPDFAIAVDNVRSDARVAVLADGSEIVGFFPFEQRRFGIAVPIGAGLSDCQGLVHVPTASWDSQELLRACKVTAWKLDNLVQGQQPFDRYVDTVIPAPVIDLTDGFAAYQKKLCEKSPQFLKDIARKARNLARDSGDLRFVVDSRDIAELRILMGWKSAQYRQSRRSDIFDRPWVVDLIDYLFSIHNEWFDGMLSVLYAGEAPVAAHFGIRSSQVLSDWFPAYDSRYRKRSPGMIKFLRLAENTAAMGVHTIEMGTGDERYKQTLRSHDLFLSRGVMGRGPLLASAFRRRGTLASLAHRHIKRYPPVFHTADRLLRHYGRIG